MIFKKIHTQDLEPNTLNPREVVGREFNRLVTEMKRGHIKSAILVASDGDKYRIVDGHHRVLAAEKAGIDLLPAIIAENYEEEEQLADLIRMNEQVAEIDEVKLAKIIRRLRELGWDYEELEKRLAYDEDVLIRYDGLLDFSFDTFKFVDTKPVEMETRIDYKIKCTQEQKDKIDQVIEKCLNSNESIESREGALLLVCQSFLEHETSA